MKKQKTKSKVVVKKKAKPKIIQDKKLVEFIEKIRGILGTDNIVVSLKLTNKGSECILIQNLDLEKEEEGNEEVLWRVTY